MNTNKLLTELSRIAPLATQSKLLPILSNVKLDFSASGITASTTDLQSYVSVNIDVETSLSTTICVDCIQFINILKGFGDADTELDVKNNQLIIKSGKSKYKLPIVHSEDFPKPPTITTEEIQEVDSDVIKNAINSTLFATSKDDLRPAMCGIFFDKDKVVSTDAHKLVRVDLEQPLNINAILPGNACRFLALTISDNITIATSKTNLFATWGNCTFSTRLVDERYPDYNAVIPNTHNSRIIIETKHFIDILSRLALTSNKQTSQIKLSLGTECTATSCDVDLSLEGVETLNCQYEGEPLEIGFNGKFLLESLRTIQDTVIKINLISPNKAVVIECYNKIVLVMPVMI